MPWEQVAKETGSFVYGHLQNANHLHTPMLSTAALCQIQAAAPVIKMVTRERLGGSRALFALFTPSCRLVGVTSGSSELV